MLTEDYVNSEIAKLLDEKGFDGKCSRIWVKEENQVPTRIAMSSFVEGEEIANRETVELATSYNNKYKFKTPIIVYLCPTLQMAIKWLREEKGIAIIPIISSVLDNEKFLWDVKIVIAETHDTYSQGWVYEKQEVAYETAIKYCLENLI